MQNTLATRLQQALPGILEEQPVELAYLYGSTVTGYATTFSDVDIALVVNAQLEPLAQLKLIQYVQLELYEHCDILEADVRIINEAPLVLRGKVVTEGLLVYARNEETRVEFETTTRMRYFDYLPIHKRLQNAFFDDLRTRGLYGR